jgi:hypothetical protein
MLFDLPESLIEKVRKTMTESEQPLPSSESEKETPPEQPEGEKTDTPEKRKGEPVEINPEIRPDIYTEPYKVQPTT